MNRTLSGRRRSSANANRHRFSIGSFRGYQQPQLSKKLNRVIKSENSAISAHESAARQRISIAEQVSEWGETTEDEAISDISDKLGVLLAEMGEQEDVYAQNLEEYRTILKHIRDTESSVQPTRDQRAKVSDDIQRLKLKEPNSYKIETLEQELVRAEAQNLVAEAQLTNVTRQRFKEAYNIHLAAVIERGEKQVLLARHARRLLNCLDDTSVIPGDEPRAYAHGSEAKQIIEEAEREMRSWESNLEPIVIADSGTAAIPGRASLPTSTGEIREAPATESQVMESQAPESQAPEYLEREQEYARAQQAQAENARAQQTREEYARTQQVQAENARAQQTQEEYARAQQAQAEYARAQQVQEEYARAQQAQAEYARAQQAQAEEAQAEETQAEDVSVSDEYSYVSPTYVAPRARVQSMSAPMMEANILEERAPSAMTPTADRVESVSRENEVKGVNKLLDERQKASGTKSAQDLNGGFLNKDFAFRPKKGEPTHLGTPLDAQVQRLAVPI